MNDYKEAKDFWNIYYKDQKGYKVEGKFVDCDLINNIFKEKINENSVVLDYGCGSGWGIFEMYLTKNFKKGIGVDTASYSIEYAIDCNKLSGFGDKIEFICGDETALSAYNEHFDFVFSTNVLDVVPDEITEKIIDALYASTKKDGYLLICLNPNFTEEELVNLLKMEKRGNYYYKNNILRCNYKSVSEWENIFSKKFTLIESKPFKLMSQDKFERRMYLLKK